MTAVRRALLLTLGLLAAPGARAAWPDRPITIINPYATGTSSDIAARMLAESFTRDLGVSVVVTNRDGGSGVVGMRTLTASAPDGYTLALTAMTPLVVQPHLLRNTGLGPEAVAPVCNVSENVLGIIVRADNPVRDVPGLVAAAHARALSFGSPGPNSIPQLGVVRIQAAAGGEYVHVAFRGDAASVTETIAGRLDFSALVVASAGQQIRDGTVRLIGVFSDRRHPEFPDVRTMREQGIEAVQLSYASLYAPRGTPEPILTRLDDACRAGMDTDRFRAAAHNVGMVVDYRPRDVLQRLMLSEYAEFGRVLARLGVVAE